ncbi:MAG: 6-carboxy-5,6,7,8-tetrahydropterin synthase [Acidobacteriota bacterium]
MSVVLERLYRFSASHLYRRQEWSDEENFRRFGKCATLPGHGHNYRLLVRVAGAVDPETGFVVDLGALDEAVRRSVIEPLDHRHINEAIADFAIGGRIPSSENLVLWIRERLVRDLPERCALVGLRLAEDDDLAASWTSEGEAST